MPRTITVKGVGKASIKPDFAIISLTLNSKDIEYERAMTKATDHLLHLKKALCEAGFEEDSAKTANFCVQTRYESYKNSRGEYENRFAGYEVVHHLKVSFDLNMSLLGKALSAIARSLSRPQLSILFSVKDSAAVNEKLLRDATENARSKAVVLCNASGATLGQLMSINYDWREVSIYSNTRVDCFEKAMAPMAKAESINIDPEDIEVCDDATFVWEIK